MNIDNWNSIDQHWQHILLLNFQLKDIPNNERAIGVDIQTDFLARSATPPPASIPNSIPEKILQEIFSLEAIFAANNQISDLKPIHFFQRIKFFDGCFNLIDEIGPLGKLVYLEQIFLENNSIKDISPLSGLVRLENINLRQNKIYSIAPLTSLPELTNVDMSVNFIDNIDPIAGHQKIRQLNIAANSITDISVLSTLKALSHLDISSNPIPENCNIEFLLELEHLKRIRLKDCGIKRNHPVLARLRINGVNVLLS